MFSEGLTFIDFHRAIHYISCIKAFFVQNTEKDFCFPLASTVFFVLTMEVNGNQNSLVTNIFQNIFIYVSQNKEMHIEWYEGRIFIFVGQAITFMSTKWRHTDNMHDSMPFIFHYLQSFQSSSHFTCNLLSVYTLLSLIMMSWFILSHYGFFYNLLVKGVLSAQNKIKQWFCEHIYLDQINSFVRQFF